MNQLDISRIQAASPYTVEEVANGIYLFETDHDVLYKIELEEDAPIGGCDTYQFYINNVRHVHAERDTKVKQTVVAHHRYPNPQFLLPPCPCVEQAEHYPPHDS